MNVLRVLGEYVHVRRITLPETTKSGLHLPSGAVVDDFTVPFVVLGTSSKVDERNEVHPGDRVIINKFAGAYLNDDGTERMVRIEDVICVVGKDDVDLPKKVSTRAGGDVL